MLSIFTLFAISRPAAPSHFQKPKSPTKPIRRHGLGLLTMIAGCYSAGGGRYVLITNVANDVDAGVSWHISAPSHFQRPKSPTNPIRRYGLGLLTMIVGCYSAGGGCYVLITNVANDVDAGVSCHISAPSHFLRPKLRGCGALPKSATNPIRKYGLDLLTMLCTLRHQ